ncbi:MAG: hydrogenase maturation nickel metallochaperone HypA [Hyphomicrobiales bacterium]|nr:hydrogenase maturation nickel metallochaperone HypA [Hyphomicrobiales bacterium]
MHEMALTESIVDILQEEARRRAFSRVTLVRLEIGALGHVDPRALVFCFDAVSRGTIADGAALDIVSVPGQGWCFDCEKATPLEERFGACAHCGGRRVQMTGGDEMRVKEMEVE